MNNDESLEIRDEGTTDRYFHVMLNLADDMLDPYEYRLLGHYRRVCGAKNVPCTEGTRTTAERCKMSTGKVSETRKKLAAEGWIRITGEGNRTVVTLVDRMSENVARYSGEKDRSPDERSPDEQPSKRRNVHRMNVSFTTRTKRSPHERKRSSGEQKKKHIKKQPVKEPAKTSSTGDRGNQTGGEQVDDDGFIRNQATALGLSEENCEKLIALGADQALGLLIMARRRATTNPAGLLLTMLGSEQPPAADDLALVPLALELRTLEPDRLDREQRARRLKQAMVGENVESAADGTQPVGLDEKPGGTLTVREIWQATLGQLQLQLNRDTFSQLKRAQPARFEAGVLTVRSQQPHTELTIVRLQEMLDRVVSRVAGVDIHVRCENEKKPTAHEGAAGSRA